MVTCRTRNSRDSVLTRRSPGRARADFTFEIWREDWVAVPLYLYRHDDWSAFRLPGVLATVSLGNQHFTDTTVGECFAAWWGRNLGSFGDPYRWTGGLVITHRSHQPIIDLLEVLATASCRGGDSHSMPIICILVRSLGNAMSPSVGCRR
ncbi:hypothetical protein BDN71DRAFT_1451210 [Pleurotus eryngii]|uniref:Uncharacterized protein n=1 Tax=Pleurotus eryngii TaxID=5323 RepID=A0A9P5ZT69_PLEER|nr:hypothetical protein BDN71DRAFT_1451210 [Pleurotus eryngii]